MYSTGMRIFYSALFGLGRQVASMSLMVSLSVRTILFDIMVGPNLRPSEKNSSMDILL